MIGFGDLLVWGIVMLLKNIFAGFGQNLVRIRKNSILKRFGVLDIDGKNKR